MFACVVIDYSDRRVWNALQEVEWCTGDLFEEYEESLFWGTDLRPLPGGWTFKQRVAGTGYHHRGSLIRIVILMAMVIVRGEFCNDIVIIYIIVFACFDVSL